MTPILKSIVFLPFLCYFFTLTLTAEINTGTKEGITIGTKYLIKTVYGKQDCYITVHDDEAGTVNAQYLIGDRDSYSKTQLWSIQPHPSNVGSYQLTQDAVPFNALSGYQNTDDYDPPLFPRQLTFVEAFPDKWQIQIRVRWCLRFQGLGNNFDIDDCEGDYYYEPEKLWEFIPVQ